MRFLLGLAALVLLAMPARADAPRVLVSIAPLAGIAAAVMEGVGTPTLLVQGNASPHTYQLRPSDAQHIANADLILWVGPELEGFLARPLAALSSSGKLLTLATEPRLQHLPARTGPLWEAEHDHHHDHGHDHGPTDPHLWLSLTNAQQIAQLLAARLAQLDSAHAARYQANAAAFGEVLTALKSELTAQLAPVQPLGLLVFHDAYQYFEREFDLQVKGALTLTPERAPSAKHLAALQQRLTAQAINCVLAEPQFSSAMVAQLVKGSAARHSSVNPDASDLPLTAQLYQDYMRRLASGFAACVP